ncbi:serine/threonine protein kinase [Frankia sp. QA3]|uniref:serine/threonine protein kinase n=1 Tax=Frankia sp. QA3 TaxID=710111 RepID=UPI000269BBBD|nr:serine/threonine protein kinase [Frankia sp. QA3]EIV91738.1 protein kinase family protein [Frankia sp. QA3]
MATDRAAGQERRLAGRYRLGRVLGSGGGGVVREGEDTLLRRRVAIKEVRRPPVASPAERAVLSERVLREARAAARLRHPGLVTVYDVLDADDHTWIVMEYVDGTSLADLIRASGRLPPLDVARIGLSLAYALEAAHRGGVVHRDVKPGNVLVTADGQARLTDFGIAVTEGDATLTEAGTLVGSPAYIAPERARGARVGAAGDVWGLGATLFTAVEGVPPFEGDGPLAILAAVVEDRRRPFQHSGPLRGVLTELLDSDPARRPSLAEARGRLREIADRLEEEDHTLGGTLVEIPQPDLDGAAPPPAAFVASAALPAPAGAPAPAAGVPPEPAGQPAPADPSGLAGGPSWDAPPGSAGEPGPVGASGAAGTPASRPDASRPDASRPDASRPDADRPARRRRVALLAGVAAAVLAAAAIVLGLVLAGGGSEPSRPTAAATSPATGAASPAPRASATSTAGTKPPTATSAPAGGPSPTGTPSAQASASPAGSQVGDDLGALIPDTTDPADAPDGYTTHRDRGGWSAALPAGWRTSERGNGRLITTAPSGYPDLLIEVQPKAGPSAIGAWHDQEPAVRGSSAGYRRLSIRPADGGAGTSAAIWEFTFTSGGRTIHVLDFGVVRNGHGYGLRWRVPEQGWDAALGQMRTIVASFRPGP